MLEGILLGGLLGSIDGVVIDSNEGMKLRLSYRNVSGTIHGNVDGIALGIDVGTDLGPLDECFLSLETKNIYLNIPALFPHQA